MINKGLAVEVKKMSSNVTFVFYFGVRARKHFVPFSLYSFEQITDGREIRSSIVGKIGLV